MRKRGTVSKNSGVTREFYASVISQLPDLTDAEMRLYIRSKKELGRRLRKALLLENTIFIDRTHPFDPVKFLGHGYVIEEEDERSLALTELDLSKIRLEHVLEPGEVRIGGEEKLRRLKKTDYIRLDAKVFQFFWENQEFIPEEWKKPGAGYFDGTIFRDSVGYRYVLCLGWDGGQWSWSWRWLEDGWYADVPSALLENAA